MKSDKCFVFISSVTENKKNIKTERLYRVRKTVNFNINKINKKGVSTSAKSPISKEKQIVFFDKRENSKRLYPLI